jgi:hypothetical protein
MGMIGAAARCVLAAWVALAVASGLGSPSLAQFKSAPTVPPVHTMPTPVLPSPSTGVSPSIQLSPSIQAAPAPALTAPSAPAVNAAPPTATVVVPYCDKFPDQCRRHAHAPHAHAPHDSSQCACEWYDHSSRRWVGGQFARSCCR